jgi:transcriptional regulator with XRE-family HTH domain
MLRDISLKHKTALKKHERRHMPADTDIGWIAERLRRTRKDRGLTLQEVFDQTGVPVATLSRIETGATKDIKSATLIALTNWMGVSIEELHSKPSPVSKKGKLVHKTPDIVELHLRADKTLRTDTAAALASLFRTAYDHYKQLQEKSKKT